MRAADLAKSFSGTGLYVLATASALGLGSVHVQTRTGLSIALVAWAGTTLWVGGPPRLSPASRVVTFALLGAVALGLMTLLPMAPAMRSAFSSELVAREIAVLDNPLVRPTAPDPGAAVRGLAFQAALLASLLGMQAPGLQTRTLLRAVCGSGAIVGSVGLLGLVVGLDSPLGLSRFGADGAKYFSTFISANHAGAFLACCGAAAAIHALTGDRHRSWYVAAASICIISLGVSGSRAAPYHLAVGLSLGAVVWFEGTRRSLAAGALATLILLPVVLPDALLKAYTAAMDPSFYGTDLYSGRAALYQENWSLAGVAPIFGLGAGGYAVAHRALADAPNHLDFQHAHNEAQQVLVEQGVGGALLLLVALVGMTFCVARAPRQRSSSTASAVAGLGAMSAASLVDFPLRSGANALLATLLVGVILRAVERPRASSSNGRWVSFAALAVLAVLGHFGSGQYGRAAQAREKALKALEQGELSAARAHMDDAIIRRPLDASTWGLVATLALKQTDYPRAKQALWKAHLSYPRLVAPRLGAARLHRALGETQESLHAYRDVLGLAMPGDPRVAVREALSGTHPAIRAIAVWPSREDRQCLVAIALSQKGEHEAAASLLGDVGARECPVEWSMALTSAGDPVAALTLLGQRHGCGADHAAGAALLALGQPVEALPRLQAAMDSCREKPLTLRIALGRAKMTDSPREGLRILRAAVEDHPSQDWARRRLILELREQGRRTEAAEHSAKLSE